MGDSLSVDESTDGTIDDEVEFLREILEGQGSMYGKIQYDRRCQSVTVCISPDDSYKFVQLELELSCGDVYPDEIPLVKFKTSRGLSDASLEDIRTTLVDKGEENLGSPMLFQMVEMCQEHITSECTLPCDLCAVCLDGFDTAEGVHMTPCSHFVHRRCIAELLKHHHQNAEDNKVKYPAARRPDGTCAPQQQHVVPCPVCCASLVYDPFALEDAVCAGDAREGADDGDLAGLMADIREAQQERARVYARQRDIGGIIDTAPQRVLNIRSPTEDFSPPAISNGPGDDDTHAPDGVPVEPVAIPAANDSDRSLPVTDLPPPTSQLLSPISQPNAGRVEFSHRRRRRGMANAPIDRKAQPSQTKECTDGHTESGGTSGNGVGTSGRGSGRGRGRQRKRGRGGGGATSASAGA